MCKEKHTPHTYLGKSLVLLCQHEPYHAGAGFGELAFVDSDGRVGLCV